MLNAPNAAAAATPAARPAQPMAWQINAERLHMAVDNAHAAGVDKGYRHGYVAGARSGRLVGLLWGLLLGGAAVGAALKLGWLAGGGK